MVESRSIPLQSWLNLTSAGRLSMAACLSLLIGAVTRLKCSITTGPDLHFGVRDLKARLSVGLSGHSPEAR
jgi:hypothetical protein